MLVPLLIGLDPSVALLTAGVGTLIFHAVTKGKVPIFLGSSFAFIAPVIKATELYSFVWNNRCWTRIWNNESTDPSSRCRIHHSSLSTCCCRPGNYAHRTFIGRNRRGYGKDQLAPCHHCASDHCRRIAFWKRNISPDSYLFRNYSRIHCFNMLRPCGFSACLGCKMVRSSSVRAS